MSERARKTKLLSLKQFAARHESFTVGALECVLFRRRQPNENGPESALVLEDGRVLIDEEKFFQWLKAEHLKESGAPPWREGRGVRKRGPRRS
jgi:hypothetical protein